MENTIKENEQRKATANEFVNVRDIKSSLLYSKDNYMFGYLRVYATSFALMTDEELAAETNKLVSNFKGDNSYFSYFSLPRQVDIDELKNFQEKKYVQEISNQKRKQVLGIMIQQSVELSTNNENYEHHHFFKMWSPYKEGKDNYLEEQELKNRLAIFQNYYRAINVKTEILTDTEIMKICNLFANGVKASYEDISNLHYTKHTVIQ